MVNQLHTEQATTLVQFLLPMAVPQQAIVANALEPVRQNVEQETPDEFVGAHGHGFDLIALFIILPLEFHLIVFDVEEPVIGDGDAMGITAHVIEHLFRSGKWPLGVNDPFELF